MAIELASSPPSPRAWLCAVLAALRLLFSSSGSSETGHDRPHLCTDERGSPHLGERSHCVVAGETFCSCRSMPPGSLGRGRLFVRLVLCMNVMMAWLVWWRCSCMLTRRNTLSISGVCEEIGQRHSSSAVFDARFVLLSTDMKFQHSDNYV